MNAASYQINEFLERGYTKIESLLSPVELIEVESAVHLFLKDEAPFLKGRDINYADSEKTTINSIHRLNTNTGNYFDRFIVSEKMKKVASDLLQAEAIARGAEFFAKPAKVGLKVPPHQDLWYWCLKPVKPLTALTVWIALDEINYENGVVRYYEKSHLVGLLNHVDSFAPGSSQMVDAETVKRIDELNFKAVLASLKPGDALVHDALLLHDSSPNVSNKSRRVITAQYQSILATVDVDRKKEYEKKLMNQIKIRENQEIS